MTNIHIQRFVEDVKSVNDVTVLEHLHEPSGSLFRRHVKGEGQQFTEQQVQYRVLRFVFPYADTPEDNTVICCNH